MARVSVHLRDDGGALVDLAPGTGGEVRHVVELSELAEAGEVAALGALVLHFDHYGRLGAIEVTGSAGSVLPPALLEGDP